MSEEQTAAYELFPDDTNITASINLNADETECYLNISFEKPFNITAEMLVNALKEQGIIYGLDMETIGICCSVIGTGKSVENILVAKGKHAVEGKESFVDFKIRPSSDSPEYDHDAAGGIDYHHAHLFENVHAGETIAIIQPPVPGQVGHTVRDRPIPVHGQQGKDITMKAGDGVELRNNGTECAAVQDGRIVFKGGVVSVTDELRIDGDVDYETGDIDFIGFVRITGDVHDDYNVRAVKGIKIDKNVGHCNLESDGDIELGGMSGNGEKGSIKCGGNLTARYLHTVSVECEGDVYILNEAMDCRIHASGFVVIPKLLAGGECMAAAGIEAGRIGTDGNVKTRLTAGTDYRFADDIDELNEEIKVLQEELTGLVEKATTYKQNDEKGLLSHEEKEAMTLIFFDIDDLKQKRGELEEKLKAIHDQLSDRVNPKINIRKEIHKGTTLHLGKSGLYISERRDGAYSVIEYKRSELRFAPLSQLPKKASEIEAELIAKERAEEAAKIEAAKGE